MKKLATLLLITSFSVFGANISTKYISVEKLRISEETKIAYVDIGGTTESINSTCSSGSYYAIDTNDQNFNSMYSTLLTAAAAGKEVKFWISDIAKDCLNNNQRIKVVEIKF